jgi:hypothetical protein
MRNLLIGAVTGLVAMIGFAGTASASATVDLIWAGSGTATTSSASESSNITLNIVLTAGPAGTYGGSVAVDYSAAVGKLVYVSSAGGPYPGGTPLNGTNTGTSVTGVGVLNFAVLGAAGTSGILGHIVFHKGPGEGTFEITANANAPEGILTGAFGDANPTINSAFVVNPVVPEPGTVSLLALGLGGLALAGRRKN